MGSDFGQRQRNGSSDAAGAAGNDCPLFAEHILVNVWPRVSSPGVWANVSRRRFRFSERRPSVSRCGHFIARKTEGLLASRRQERRFCFVIAVGVASTYRCSQGTKGPTSQAQARWPAAIDHSPPRTPRGRRCRSA